MTPEQIATVRRTMAEIEQRHGLFAQTLYGRLFDQRPETMRLFKGSRDAQEQQLAAMMRMVIASLDRVDGIRPTLRSLGHRHRLYGVVPADYAAFGSAMLATVEGFLGSGYTAEVRIAWTAFYTLVSGIMQGDSEQNAELEAMLGLVDG